MAASCISASVSTACTLAAGKAEIGFGRQSGRVALAVPSIADASSQSRAGVVAGLALFSLGGSRAVRNAGIAARAADLEEPETRLSPEETSSSPLPALTQGSKLYVGNLPWSVSSKQLAEIFQACGNVELVEVIFDRETQKSRGFAFVTMSSIEDAERAIERLDGYELDSRVIKVNFPQTAKDGRRKEYPNERPPRRERSQSGYGGRPGGNFGSENKIFIGNLSWGVDDVSLEELFSEYGKVLEAKVVYDNPTGRSRGFGFVVMSQANEVNLAIQSLDGAEFDGRNLRVNLAGDKPPPRDNVRRDY